MMPVSITFLLHFQATTSVLSHMGEFSYKYPHYCLHGKKKKKAAFVLNVLTYIMYINSVLLFPHTSLYSFTYMLCLVM